MDHPLHVDGVALYAVLREGLGRPAVQFGLAVFCIQLALNVIWSLVFFGRRSPLGGLVVILILWLTIMSTIIVFLPVSVIAGILLVPYIAWCSVATALNYDIMKLN